MQSSLLTALYSASQVLTSTDEIEMWGDGKQTRSFTFIDDCVEGILRITKSDFTEVCARSYFEPFVSCTASNIYSSWSDS